MQVDILYIENCPNYVRACAVICDVIAELNLDSQIHITKVDDDKIDEFPLFRGSPTILVNGVEVEQCFHDANSDTDAIRESFTESVVSASHSFSNDIACKLYNCEIHPGCPTPEMIRCAVNNSEIIS